MIIPSKCPKCGGTINYHLDVDTAGQHWRCVFCGLTDSTCQRFRLSGYTKVKETLNVGAPFDEPFMDNRQPCPYTDLYPYIDLYQYQTARTDTPKERNEAITNYCFGLVGEIGEVVDCIKKQRWQGHSDDVTREKIADELGDVMWYICRLATTYNIYMSEILGRNVEKLQKRYPNGFSVKDSVERNEEEHK